MPEPVDQKSPSWIMTLDVPGSSVSHSGFAHVSVASISFRLPGHISFTKHDMSAATQCPHPGASSGLRCSVALPEPNAMATDGMK